MRPVVCRKPIASDRRRLERSDIASERTLPPWEVYRAAGERIEPLVLDIAYDADDLRICRNPEDGRKPGYGPPQGIFTWEIKARGRFTQYDNGSSGSAIGFVKIAAGEEPRAQCSEIAWRGRPDFHEPQFVPIV